MESDDPGNSGNGDERVSGGLIRTQAEQVGEPTYQLLLHTNRAGVRTQSCPERTGTVSRGGTLGNTDRGGQG